MNKAELLNMKPILATPSMMKAATAEKTMFAPHDKAHKNPVFKTAIVFRGRYENGILMISVFSTKDMRLGAKTPKYTVYMDVANRQFITWDHNGKKWREAMLYNLSQIWPYYSDSKTDESAIVSLVKRYLKTEMPGYRGIYEWQSAIRADQLRARHKRETDPWDARMNKVGTVPANFYRWVEKTAIPDNFIFYRYVRNVKTGWCSHCERDVPIKKPRHNAEGKCPHCRSEITYKAIGRCGVMNTGRTWCYLIQRYDDGFIIREFWANKHYGKGAYKTPKVFCEEVRRVIFDPDLNYDAYYYGEYKHVALRWIKDENLRTYQGFRETDGKVYPHTIYGLKAVDKTGLREMLRDIHFRFDPEYYIANLRKKPYIEQIAKAGLPRLTMDYVKHRDYIISDEDDPVAPIAGAKSLGKALQIDKARLNRLQKRNGGLKYLQWLIHEKKHNRCIPDAVIEWLIKNNIKPENVTFISNRMTELQIKNYLVRQQHSSGEKISSLLSMWEDYLHMAQRIKMDVNDAIVYRAKDLRRRHDDLVKYIGDHNIAIRAGEVADKFPDVDTILAGLQEKYSYEDDTYAILVPKRIEDILNEGETLHHCIDRTDRYFERIQQHESYLMFLRKKEDISKAWYTLEVEPGGTIRQRRTEYNRQNKDLKDAQPFLEAWQKEIAKRMSEDDHTLAASSKEMRLKEFAELREQGAKIQTGYMAGFLLADVLQADLMESVGA